MYRMINNAFDNNCTNRIASTNCVYDIYFHTFYFFHTEFGVPSFLT